MPPDTHGPGQQDRITSSAAGERSNITGPARLDIARMSLDVEAIREGVEEIHNMLSWRLPPDTAVTVHEPTCQTCGSDNNGCGVVTEAVAGGAMTRWLCRMTEAAR